MTQPAGAGRPWRHAQPVTAAHWSRPLLTLQSTKHDEIFTYGIGATQGTSLTHLGLTAGDNGS
jgi:hypothetical protein